MSATKPSGWCSDYQGVCSSKGLHAICQERLDDGRLNDCGCENHDDTDSEDH